MATVKVKFRASSVATKEGTLFYQVIHKRIVRQIHTGYKLFPAEWYFVLSPTEDRATVVHQMGEANARNN